ncbi:exonuclease domain-containing protein [Streptomyces misionensis]|uniref:exonuclease domain-containing protein n=1 Tax=Streptomyces misionensis TaxID=67331 RepID=UPI001646B38B|nr:3'-5' exonuclease [Streptomyces misionensis]
MPFTSFDTGKTGITAAVIQQADSAAVTLAALEALLAHPPYVLFAHNAPYEAGLIYDQESSCPALARLPMLDTVRLDRAVYPGLPRHRLDDVLSQLGMPPPARRHRAMPDVLATCAVFARMVTDGAGTGRWSTLTDLHRVAGIEPKAARDDAQAAAPPPSRTPCSDRKETTVVHPQPAGGNDPDRRVRWCRSRASAAPARATSPA